MPTLETVDYARFNYEDDAPLSLNEAVKKAAALRRKDSTNFYRVELVDEKGTAFTVKKVPAASVYADFIARVSKVMGRYFLRPLSR